MRKTYDFTAGLAIFFSIVLVANANFQLIPTSASYLSANQWKEATVTVPSSDKTQYLKTLLSLDLNNVPLQVALDVISAKTDVRFSYSKEIVPVERRVSVNVEKAPLAEALDKTLSTTDLVWIPQENNQVVITERTLVQQGKGNVKGRVVDQNGSPVAFANILVLGTTMGAAADANGYYMIENIPAGTHTLRASAVGYRRADASVVVTDGQTSTENFTLQQDVLGMSEVVVTGTMAPRENIQSSVALSTINPKEMTLANPRSTTEVLRYIPGFTRVESSGGEVNENYTMRGIYGVEYIMFMEDGLPVFPTMHTFFMNADNLFRIDENIDHIEVVRGGNSALFGSNTPAAVVNLINKTGGPELQGITKATVGTQGLARFDFDLNGPMGPEWRFDVGGFYRYDHGVRDPGFPGIKGGQLKANITRLLDNGYIRIYGKYVNDQNQFILDLPHDDPANPTQYAPGFGNYGSFNSPEGLNISVPTPNGALSFPLNHGIMTNAGWLTADINLNFGEGWNVRNQTQVMSDYEEWNAIVPFNAVPVNLWVLSEAQTLQSNGFIPRNVNINNVTAQLFYTNQFDETGKPIAFPNANLSPLNNLVAPGGEWHVAKPLTAFQEQLQMRKSLELPGSLFYHHDLSLGLYFADYTQVNKWYFSDILTDVQNITHFLDAKFYYPDPSNPGQNKEVSVTRSGFMHYVSNYVNGSGETTIFSAVLSDQMMVTDRLRLDIAGRWESDNFVQSSENTSIVQPDGSPVTAATPPYAVELWGNNTYRHLSKNISDWAFSAGINYQIVPDEFSFYAQGSRAYKMPALDELLNAVSPDQVALFEDKTTVNYEAGFKFNTPAFGFTVDGFWGELRNITGQGAILDTTTGRTQWVILHSPQQRTYGGEFEIFGNPVANLNLMANGTILKAEIAGGSDIGSWIAGVPPFIGNLSGTYTWNNFMLLADLHYVGKRWIDQASNTYLPAYTYMNLGLSYRVPDQGITMSLNLLNVYQGLGLEEGNPRLVQYPGNRTSNYFLARPILPRRLTFTVGYQF